MKTIIEALQSLYVAMGGQAADVADLTVTPDMIDAIADVYEDKGDTLPTVTDADNAKLLTVVNGAWDKADAPKELPAVTNTDNGKVLKVVNSAWTKTVEQTPVIYPEYTYDETNSEWVCDRPFEDLAAWIANGRVAIAKMQVGESLYALIPISGAMYQENNIVAIAFSQAAPSGSGDVRYLATAYIEHSALGIEAVTGSGYLSASDPNT